MENVTFAYRLPVGRQNAIHAICLERLRQNRLHGDHTLDNGISDYEKLCTLIEEVGEVAKELSYDTAEDRDNLRCELVQVAALAVAWLEGLHDER